MNPPEPSNFPPPLPAEEPDDFKAMMIGAGFIFVVAFIPYAVFACCLPQIVGVLLAIHLYTSQYRLTLSFGEAVKLGIFTVLIGSLCAFAVSMLLLAVFKYHVGGEISGLIENWTLNFMKSHNVPADQIEQARNNFEQQKLQGVTVTMVVGGLVGSAVGAAITGLIGGAIGKYMFKRGPEPVQY